MNTKTKIIKIATLRRNVSTWRKKGYKIAFTNGCFDLMHAGHASYLEAAKKKGRILVVGLNSDRSVREIKGETRPILDEKARAIMLAALACVDYVTIFDESTPYQLISSVQPDLLIKGADWKDKGGAIGSDIVKARGGKVEYIEYIKGLSSTNIIERIRLKCEK